MSTVGVGLAVGDGLLVDGLPDEQVTEFPSAERVQTMCELLAGDDEGLAVGTGDVPGTGVTRRGWTVGRTS